MANNTLGRLTEKVKLSEEQRVIWKKLIERHYQKTFKYILFNYRNETLAEDITQEVFGIVLPSSLAKGNIKNPFGNGMQRWFERTAFNTISNIYKKENGPEQKEGKRKFKFDLTFITAYDLKDKSPHQTPEQSLRDKDEYSHFPAIRKALKEGIEQLSFRHKLIGQTAIDNNDPRQAFLNHCPNNKQFNVYYPATVKKLRSYILKSYPQFRDLTEFLLCG